MKIKNKLGFTLIELLVVITIIGILATWAVAVYTSQIQKARDSNRINDVKVLESWVSQFYQDVSEYPTWDDFWTWWTNQNDESVPWVQTYVPKIPKDPKNKESCNKWGWSQKQICAYRYYVWNDNNGISLQEYEISTAFENWWNISSKAKKDDWNDNFRYEVWVDIASNDSSLHAYPSSETNAAQNDKDIIIAWKAIKK